MLNMCLRNKIKIWDPLKVLFRDTEICNNFVFVVLNTAINACGKDNLLLNLWNKACMRVTVDGGTFRWFSWLKQQNIDEKNVNPPSYITGDLDSVPYEVVKKIQQKYPNVEVIKTMDQNETDFTKALRVIDQKTSELGETVSNVLVLVDSSGRIDQVMGNLNTLYLARDIFPKATVYLLGSESLSWLLYEGFHKIIIPNILSNSKAWCSLIPVGRPAIVTTTGLKWNLENTVLEFGKIVSTSNTYNRESTVTVLTNEPILWSMDIYPMVANSNQRSED